MAETFSKTKPLKDSSVTFVGNLFHDTYTKSITHQYDTSGY